MEVIEKEEFAFSLLNDLLDNHTLHSDDYTRLGGQIQEANTHQEMDGIIKFLQNALLDCMKGAIQINQGVA